MSDDPKTTNPKSSVEDLSDDDIFMSVKELKTYVAEIEMAKAKKSVESMGRAEKAEQELLARLKSDEPISQEPATDRRAIPGILRAMSPMTP